LVTGLLEFNLDQLYKRTHAVMPQPLEQTAYPTSVFWKEKDWEDWVKREKEKGKFKRTRGEGVNSSWMVNADGERVDLDQQQRILGEARRTWNTMTTFQIPLTTHRWASVPILDYFRARMESKFPELQLCADHWKADRVWKENYSSWNKPPEQEGEPTKVNMFQSHKSTF